jgi:hypothetical protein
MSVAKPDNPASGPVPKIRSVALTATDEENLSIVERYLATENHSVAIRFALKDLAGRLSQPRHQPTESRNTP